MRGIVALQGPFFIACSQIGISFFRLQPYAATAKTSERKQCCMTVDRAIFLESLNYSVCIN